MTALARSEEYRALELFDHIPAGHTGVVVTNDAFEPHLRSGEIAVVDIDARDPVHGELFVIRHRGTFDDVVTRIVQMFGREVLNENLEPWIGWFARYKFVQPGEIVLSDGPIRADAWSERRCVGRVVGYLAPEWEGRR